MEINNIYIYNVREIINRYSRGLRMDGFEKKTG